MGCVRVNFAVLGWNTRAAAFYKRLGASDLTVEEDWHFYRLEKDALERMSHELTYTAANKNIQV